MGLFKRAKAKDPEPQNLPETVGHIYWTNISGTACRTDVAEGEEGTYFKSCHLWAEGGKLRAFQGEKLLFEVTNKSKAYTELEPLVGKQLKHIVMRKKQGDYGWYYMVSVKIEEPRE